MPEYRQLVKVTAKPDEREAVKALLRGMVAPSLAEPGVLVYDLFETVTPGPLYLMEVYASPESLEEHKTAPHFQHLLSVLPALLAEPFELTPLVPVP